jgi:hypothetical protein
MYINLFCSVILLIYINFFISIFCDIDIVTSVLHALTFLFSILKRLIVLHVAGH